jgi:hypothetical protein
MAADTHDRAVLRRYLLGTLADEARLAALEEDYFAREDLLDRMRETESDLVDDYLTGRLPADEREQFESHYLPTPAHRHRVAVARALQSAAAAAKPAEPASRRTPIAAPFDSRRAWIPAVAAGLALLAAGAVWTLRPSPNRELAQRSAPAPAPSAGTVPPASPSPSTAPPAEAPNVVALVLVAGSVRGSGDSAVLTIPSGATLVRLTLESDPAAPRLVRPRAIVRTVSGATIWQGAVVPTAAAQPPATARLEIPASLLPADDYVVVLFDDAGGGRESERERYFLRVRAR